MGRVEDVRNREQRYATLLDQVLVGIAETDAGGRIRFVSDTFCGIAQRPPSELIGLFLPDLTHPKERNRARNQLDGLRQGAQPLVTETRLHQTGPDAIWVRLGVTAQKDSSGRMLGYTAVITDISAAKASARKLAEEIADNKLLQDLSTRMIAEGEVHALLQDMLATAVEIMGGVAGTIQLHEPARDLLRLQGSIGLAPDLMAPFEAVTLGSHTDCGHTLRTGQRTIVENVEDAQHFTGEALRAMRELGIRATCTTPLRTRSGRLLGVFSVKWSRPHRPSARKLSLLDILARQASDVLERIQVQAALREREEHLRQLSQSLEQRVLERTSTLENQTDRLRQLSTELALIEQRERQRLAATLHDGLQQLLVGSLLHLPVGEKGDPSRVRELLHEGLKVCRGLSWELSPPWLADSDLGKALQSLARWFEENHQHKVRVEAQRGFPRLREELKLSLYSAVRELLLNSVKHSGVSESFVFLHRSGLGTVEVEVADRGRGFDAQQLDKGAGFGLHSIRERLAALGGTLSILSRPGEGAVFLLKLCDVWPEPAPHPTPSAPTDRQRPQPAPERRGEPVRIVLADDHPMVREGIAALLGRQPDMVLVGEAEDGVHLMTLLETVTPDVVILDVAMPKMDGLQATRALRSRWPSIQVIGLSLFSADQAEQGMIEAGASLFVSKDAPSDVLLGAIREVCPEAPSRHPLK